MLADLDEGSATVVIVWHTDRLTRSIVELEEYIELSDRRGIATHTVRAGTIDLATLSGRMTARILGAVARQESEHKGHRVARARQQKAMADMRDMLLRSRNAGIAVYKGEEVGRGQWEAIVEETKYRAVAAILKDPSRKTTLGATRKWLGSLLYRCGRGNCPHFVYVTQSGGPNSPSYRCQSPHGGRRRAETVEDTVIERLERDDAEDLLLPAPHDVNVAGL